MPTKKGYKRSKMAIRATCNGSDQKGGLSFKYYGNYCGPEWTASQRRSARDMLLNNPGQFDQVMPIDNLDAGCKAHDIECGSDERGCSKKADKKLVKAAQQSLASSSSSTKEKLHAGLLIPGITAASFTRGHGMKGGSEEERLASNLQDTYNNLQEGIMRLHTEMMMKELSQLEEMEQMATALDTMIAQIQTMPLTVPERAGIRQVLAQFNNRFNEAVIQRRLNQGLFNMTTEQGFEEEKKKSNLTRRKSK